MQAAGAVTTTGVLPASLIAGEVLSLTTGTGSDVALNFSCSGTEQDPAFILGGTITGTGDVMNVTGSWCIFDGTEFVDIRVSSTGDHIIYRNVEVRDHSRKNGMNIGGSNVVVTDSEIHHNQGDDRHGIQVGSGSEQRWQAWKPSPPLW